MANKDDDYHTRDRRMVPEGWGWPIIVIFICIGLIALIVVTGGRHD